MIAYTFPLLNIFWSLLMFVGLLILVVAVILCLIDNLRRADHSGWAKAGWTVLLLVVPVIGIVVYVFARPADPPLPVQPESRQVLPASEPVSVEYVSVDYLVVESSGE